MINTNTLFIFTPVRKDFLSRVIPYGWGYGGNGKAIGVPKRKGRNMVSTTRADIPVQSRIRRA